MVDTFPNFSLFNKTKTLAIFFWNAIYTIINNNELIRYVLTGVDLFVYPKLNASLQYGLVHRFPYRLN